jgi:hypothetical protein
LYILRFDYGVPCNLTLRFPAREEGMAKADRGLDFALQSQGDGMKTWLPPPPGGYGDGMHMLSESIAGSDPRSRDSSAIPTENKVWICHEYPRTLMQIRTAEILGNAWKIIKVCTMLKKMMAMLVCNVW